MENQADLSTMLRELPGQLEDMGGDVNAAYERAAEFTKQAATLPQRLRQAIGEKFEFNKDLITERANAMGEFFAEPAVARERYQDIFNPFTREALVAQSREQAGSKARALTDLLTQRGQRIEDIIGRTGEAFAGEVGAAELLTSAAQSRFSNALQAANLKRGLIGDIQSIQASEEARKQQEFDNLFNVLNITGGEIELAGKTYKIPSYEEQLRIKERITGGGKSASTLAQEARNTVAALAQSGAGRETVMGTGIRMGLDPEEAYNLWTSNTPQSLLFTKESDEQLERLYGIKRGELGKTESAADSFNNAIQSFLNQ